jgi:signal peptidase I
MPIIICALVLLALPMAGLLLLRTGLLITTVNGQSMSPTLRHGDRVLVVRRWMVGRPRKGQIVVITFASRSETRSHSLSSSEELYIKRVVACAGESFSATLFANALPAMHPVSNTSDPSPSQVKSWQIPRNHIFVCGDNGEESIDSRSWGPLALDRVLGTVARKLSGAPAHEVKMSAECDHSSPKFRAIEAACAGVPTFFPAKQKRERETYPLD